MDFIQVVIFLIVVGTITPIILFSEDTVVEDEEPQIEEYVQQQYETAEIQPTWGGGDTRTIDSANIEPMLDMAETDFLWQQKMKQDCIQLGLEDC